MFDIKQFSLAIRQIAEEKGIPEEKIIETIEAAIAAAYKKDYGQKGQIIRAKLDTESGKLELTQVHYIVEDVDDEGFLINPILKDEIAEEKIENEEGEIKIKYNEEKHLLLEEANKKDSKLEVGDEVVTQLEPHTDFGRIAAQTAKQVVIQRLREIEKNAIFDEFKDREGEAVSGVIQRREGRVVFVDLGRTNGILFPAEQMYVDNYSIGQRLRFMVLKVEESPRGPVILLSRSHPKFILKLFEFEVPEIEVGTVELKLIAREAGSRSKVAAVSYEEGVDPVGSLVGQKGVRVQTVINELGGEKIDIIEWTEDIESFIANALSPAKILDVKVIDEAKRHALAEVADDQFSLAIGKKGQNVRLAAKLTSWKIDVRSPGSKMTSEEAEMKEMEEAMNSKKPKEEQEESQVETPVEEVKEEEVKKEKTEEKDKE
jgi:N utilization substance protein A